MEYTSIEKKWRSYWDKSKTARFDPKSAKPKYYVLSMLPYPSGSNLHIGHWFNYSLTDSFARFKKMQGYNVFQPMGFDAFGLPAENYAIKTGVHPAISTRKNVETMRRQLLEMGAMFEWDYSLNTSEPDYYKWTQWLFLQFYKKGLVYQKNASVNFCSSCNTVIANEQVINGECERCGTEIKRKNMVQWFFKITDYAEELLSSLDSLDWPEKTKLMQKNWIGKSTGGEIEFLTDKKGISFKVFTTRADTLYGVSYVVLAPEHPLVEKLTTKENKKLVEDYCTMTAKTSDIERQSAVKEKTGVPLGSFAINPVNGEKVPIYIADYVLYSYGTGAVMAVPAHDERDYEFAKKYNLPIKTVVLPADKSEAVLPFTDYGVMTNSGEFDGTQSSEGKISIIKKLEKISNSKLCTQYRLRDWSVSRQRFWGCPIPIIHCKDCGAIPVEDKDLPVTLPMDVDFTPDGRSPLKSHSKYINTFCPKCGKPAERDADTLDTFVCSSWYFLRYPDNKNSDKAFDIDIINKLLPVDKYVGGAEHACMHLLYARFFTKALRDMGLLNFDEPFTSLVHQGIVLGMDGNKMSKSKGNVVNPDQYTSKFGADIFRLYLMFGFNFTEGGPWSDDGIKSMIRFCERFERLIEKYKDTSKIKNINNSEALEELEYSLNYTIKSVREDFEVMSFNTALARMMELLNTLYKVENLVDAKIINNTLKTFVRLFAPCAPHIAEEFFSLLGSKQSVFDCDYPICDETKLVKKSLELAIQINSKVKHKLTVPTNYDNSQIERLVLNDKIIINLLEGKKPKKIIIIKDRLVNIVV